MAKKEKAFNVPTKETVIYKIFKTVIMRRIYKKPEIINLAGNIEDKSIILSNLYLSLKKNIMSLYIAIIVRKLIILRHQSIKEMLI